MLLIGLVMFSMARNELIRSEVEKGHLVLENIASRLQSSLSLDNLPDNFRLADFTNDHEKSLFTSLIAVHWNGEHIEPVPVNSILLASLQSEANQCLEFGQNESRLRETSSGIFGKGQGYLVLSEAILENGEVVGAIVGAMNLANHYERTGKIRTIFFVYFFANLIILVLLGFYVLYRTMVIPIQKMVGLIEGFRDTEDFLLPDPKNDTEFQKLNKSIQRMVRRFTRNREELRSTVRDRKSVV